MDDLFEYFHSQIFAAWMFWLLENYPIYGTYIPAWYWTTQLPFNELISQFSFSLASTGFTHLIKARNQTKAFCMPNIFVCMYVHVLQSPPVLSVVHWKCIPIYMYMYVYKENLYICIYNEWRLELTIPYWWKELDYTIIYNSVSCSPQLECVIL